MGPPQTPYRPYSEEHEINKETGDRRPTALQVVEDHDACGNLAGRNILITGVSSGLGVATAAALYETGARLFLTARDVLRLENIIDAIVRDSSSHTQGFPRPEPIEMHLDSLASVHSAAEHVRAKTKALHVLINNAGVMATAESQTDDGFESQMGINHFAHFALFSELRSLLERGAKDSGATSRVICVSSSSHSTTGIRFHDIDFQKEGYDKWLSYGQSKTANIYMANCITRRFGKQGLSGLSVHPGVVETSISRHMSEEDLAGVFRSINIKAIKTHEQGAATSVWAAISPHFEDFANGGRYLSDVGESGPLVEGASSDAGGYAPHAYDEEKEEKLWRLSCAAIGLPEQ